MTGEKRRVKKDFSSFSPGNWVMAPDVDVGKDEEEGQ